VNKIICQRKGENNYMSIEEIMNKELTSEQLENLRGVLSSILGPYAFIIPKEQIENFRKKVNGDINKLDKN
jgi:hypothetical protein